MANFKTASMPVLISSFLQVGAGANVSTIALERGIVVCSYAPTAIRLVEIGESPNNSITPSITSRREAGAASLDSASTRVLHLTVF